MFHIIFSVTEGTEFWIFAGGTRKGVEFQRGDKTWMKPWYRCKEVLINQVFHSTHKENIKETKKTLAPIADSKKLCVAKYSIERS